MSDIDVERSRERYDFVESLQDGHQQLLRKAFLSLWLALQVYTSHQINRLIKWVGVCRMKLLDFPLVLTCWLKPWKPWHSLFFWFRSHLVIFGPGPMQGLHREFFARMYRECLNQLESVVMPEIVENYTIFVCTALLVPELLQFIICKMVTAAILDLGFRMIPTLYNNRSSRLVMPNLVENDISFVCLGHLVR